MVVKTRKKKRGGNGDENKNPNWKKLQEDWKKETINKRRKKFQAHYGSILDINLPKTEAATTDREAKKKEFSKFVMMRPETAVVKPREWIVGNRILRKERSFDAEKKLIAKKQKKINEKFGKNYGKKMNDVITDETHPDYFQQRKARILTLIKKKDEKSYDRLCGKYSNPTQENTGCSRKIGDSIGVNNLTGKQLLDAIAKHFNITPKDEKFKQKKGGKRTRKRRKRKKRKRRKSRRKR